MNDLLNNLDENKELVMVIFLFSAVQNSVHAVFPNNANIEGQDYVSNLINC
jgi:hypothetical protein